MTLTLISTVTVGSGGAASIDFTSIAGTYTDLLLVLSARSGRSVGYPAEEVYVTFNGSTSGYSNRGLYGTGSGSGASYNGTQAGYVGSIANMNDTTANTFGSGQIYIPNYAGATNKSMSVDGASETNATLSRQDIVAALWSNTAAITSISIKPNSATTWNQYSTASLYGITKGSGGATVSP